MSDLGCVQLNLTAPPAMLRKTCKNGTIGTGAAGASDRIGARAVCFVMQEVSYQAGQVPPQRDLWASAALPGTVPTRTERQ